jgi:hypothetical protein
VGEEHWYGDLSLREVSRIPSYNDTV